MPHDSLKRPLNPPLAAQFGWALFGEEITGMFLAGGAVVLFGLYLVQSADQGSDKKVLPER